MKRCHLSILVLVLTLGTLSLARLEAADLGTTPLKIIQTEDLSFPFALQNTQVMSGTTTIAIDVDENGKLTELLVTGYSRREFADSAVAVLQKWRFEPPKVNGIPWASVQEVSFDFSRSGVVVNMLAHEMINASIENMIQGSYAFRTYSLRELDHTPTPIQVVTPLVPAGEKTKTSHKIVVQFYIDQEGRVRLPSVGEKQVGEEHAASVLEAVRQWRFEPPLFKGRPVLVLVRQQFDFLPHSPAAKSK